MVARLVPALRAGARAALAVLLVQAAVAVALAAALPEVGHVHPAGTPDHVHALVEVGGLTAAPEARAAAPRPALGRGRRARPRLHQPRPSGPRRTRWGRAPPRVGAPRAAAPTA